MSHLARLTILVVSGALVSCASARCPKLEAQDIVFHLGYIAGGAGPFYDIRLSTSQTLSYIDPAGRLRCPRINRKEFESLRSAALRIQPYINDDRAAHGKIFDLTANGGRVLLDLDRNNYPDEVEEFVTRLDIVMAAEFGRRYDIRFTPQ